MAARSYRFVWHPLWMAGHLVVLAAAVTMVFLGHWQLTVSEHKGFSLQNFGYALQWWAFSVAAVFIWARVVRDKAHPDRQPEPEPKPAAPEREVVAYRRYVMPTVPAETDDPERARYNAYLQSLEDERRG